jgi:hypothetical protein
MDDRDKGGLNSQLHEGITMKIKIKYTNCLGFVLALCMIAISECSCSAPKPTTDPLAGWRVDQYGQPNQMIISDYQNYIRTLSQDEQKYAGPIFFYEDGAGQYAVEIKIGLNGSSWHHVLIYDKDNKRIKTIKFISGNYAS